MANCRHKRTFVLHNENITAFVASHWWPANPGHVLVIPNQHIENIYEFPTSLGGPLIEATRKVAVAMKEVYQCSGISTRQHNEPDGNQDVWHFHQHVFPRYPTDDLYLRHREKALADDVDKVRRALGLREAIAAMN